MIVGLDHILVAVDNVEQASETYRRLGFQVSAGGEHPKLGTYNALAPLSDGSYLELIGVRDRSLAERWPNTRLVLQALARDNRLATWALVTNDLPSDIIGLRARGLDIGDPIEGERLRPDGQKVAWRSAHFRDPNLPFLIEDITPHHVRVAEPSEGLGQTTFVSEIEVAAVDVPDASRVWKNLLGVIPPEDDEFTLERMRIRLVPNRGRATGLDAVTLSCNDLQAVLSNFRSAGVKFAEQAGRIEIDPVETAGVKLRLISSG